MTKAYIFFPLYREAMRASDAKEVQDALQAVTGETPTLEDGNYLFGYLAGSAYMNFPSKVLAIETDDEGDGLEERLLKPLTAALSCVFEQHAGTSSRFSIGKRNFARETSPALLYCMK